MKSSMLPCLTFAEMIRSGRRGSGPIAAKKHHVAVPYGGPPGGIAAKAVHHRQSLDKRPLLGNNPRSIAISPANRLREVNGVGLGTRQQLHNERRAIALDRFSTALKDFHFAALNVDLDDPHVFEGIAVKSSHHDVEA